MSIHPLQSGLGTPVDPHASHEGLPFKLPHRVQVASVVGSRYADSAVAREIHADQWFTPNLNRPLSWDRRISGVDTVTTASGATIRLNSSGMQSVPQPGWVVMLTGGDPVSGYHWTLYGLPVGTA